MPRRGGGLTNKEYQLLRGMKQDYDPIKERKRLEEEIYGNQGGSISPQNEAEIAQKMEKLDKIYQQKYAEAEQQSLEQEARRKALESIVNQNKGTMTDEDVNQFSEDEENLTRLQKLMKANKPQGL